jgi:hypothetical protein
MNRRGVDLSAISTWEYLFDGLLFIENSSIGCLLSCFFGNGL